MRTRAKAVWDGMMRRCYDAKSLKKWPTYVGATVCPERHDFKVFKTWFEAHYIEGFDLDKDILSEGCKIYGPDTCLFVPQWLNKFMTSFEQKKGRDLPTGGHPFKGEVQIDEAYASRDSRDK